MGEETKELRRLVIKAYHVREVQWGSENEVTENGILTVDKESSGRYKRGKEEYISDISFRIIRRKNGISIRIRSWILYRFQRKCLGILVMESLIP